MYNTRNKTTQVAIMDVILKKREHASHFKRENQASDFVCYTLLKVDVLCKFMLVKRTGVFWIHVSFVNTFHVLE